MKFNTKAKTLFEEVYKGIRITFSLNSKSLVNFTSIILKLKSGCELF